MSDSLNNALKVALYLETNDIETNRDGRISEHQRARILGQMQAVWIGMGCLWSLMTLPLIILALILSYPMVRIIILILIGIWLLGYVRATMNIRKQHRTVREDLARGEADAIQGTLVKDHPPNTRNYYLGIGDALFPVPRFLYDMATEGQPTVIYYLAESQQLLSLEYLEDGAGNQTAEE